MTVARHFPEDKLFREVHKDLESETFNFAEVDRMSGFKLKSLKINRSLPTKGEEAGLRREGKKCRKWVGRHENLKEF